MSRSWESGSTRQWRKIRAFVLDRDDHRCRLKLDGCTTIATQAHHVHGRRSTGDDPDHIIAACRHCNLKEGDPSAKDPQPRPRTNW